MKQLLAVAALAALSLITGCARHAPPAPAAAPATTSLSADAKDTAADIGGFFATLCSGAQTTFDCQNATIATRIAKARYIADVGFKKGHVSRQSAREIEDSADHAHAYLEAALDACQVTAKTGECTANSQEAHRLLGDALAVAASLPQ